MAHILITGNGMKHRAEAGDTFTLNGETYQAVAMDLPVSDHPCRDCVFFKTSRFYDGCLDVPDCVSLEVIFVRAPKE